MTREQKVGFIGVGLMGHGMAKDILEKGYPLTIMGHRNRKPVKDLVRRGAREVKSPAAMAGVIGEPNGVRFDEDGGT